MQFVLVIVTNLNLASVIFYAHLFNLLCTTLLYLYTQISSLSLSSVSFLMKGRTTLHKGHQKTKCLQLVVCVVR